MSGGTVMGAQCEQKGTKLTALGAPVLGTKKWDCPAEQCLSEWITASIYEVINRLCPLENIH